MPITFEQASGIINKIPYEAISRYIGTELNIEEVKMKILDLVPPKDRLALIEYWDIDPINPSFDTTDDGSEENID